MFEHKVLQNLDAYFAELKNRPEEGIYFYRINGYSESIREFIQKYYQAARLTGVIIEGRIPNPTEDNLAYYGEIMGRNFQMGLGFFETSLKKWLPRMDDYQRKSVAASLYDTLDDMRRDGKNENMLKNAYIKFMCWLYYKFERIVSQMGRDKVPKILYEGTISNYELKLLTILCNAGCDAVILQYGGDREYLKLDPDSRFSCAWSMPGMTGFPSDFSVKWLRKEMEQQAKLQRLYGTPPKIRNCTNAWISGKGLEDILQSVQSRGDDQTLYYNCFCRIQGVEDKLTYLNELYQFQLQMKNAKRRIVIVEKGIAVPTLEEIKGINRKNYETLDQLVLDLSRNIKYLPNLELQRLLIKVFIDIILEESNKSGINLHKLTNKAVYLLCWLNRYQTELFGNWNMPQIACFVYLGVCSNESEGLFLRFLARLPVDVLLLNPNLNTACHLEDQLLYEVHYSESMNVETFPRENADLHMGTAAYHAERDLDTLMYQDSGIYRNQQYGKAVSVTLQTMYEEIAILWDQELKYRPNFSVVDSVVNMPVVFAKVSGVKGKETDSYWRDIKSLVTDDTFLITRVPFINPTDPNPMKAYTGEFLKNGRMQRNKIKTHKAYPYGFLREEVQDYILDKLQLLIEQKTIAGTFENGTEYTIIATVLHLNKDILRMLQKFDFTRKNPKLIYINTTESMISLEDSILTAFLNLAGFDILFFVATGYQSVERYFNRKVMEEHQAGDYMYDLPVPNFDRIAGNKRLSWREKIFKRGS